MSSNSKAAMARAAMVAIEPLVEMLLEMGVTSPEAESLLRSMFVHRARAWLARLDPSAAAPSDARIALVTGVHRNFVRHILAEPPRIANVRQQKGSHAGRLLNAWYSDTQYQDAEGKPLDLPEKGDAPSFQSLVSACLPGTAAGVLLEELQRGRQVQRLPDGRIRVRSRTARTRGLTIEGVAEIGEQARELVETMRHNLRHPESRLPFESIPAEVDEESLLAARDLITRRTMTFLARLAQELAALGAAPGKRSAAKSRVAIALTVFGSGTPSKK
jgi:hypothetical protein